MRSTFLPFPLSRYYDGMAAGLKSTSLDSLFTRLDISLAVILLSFVLAVGFLMIILSCALYSNWLPLIVGGFKTTPFRFPQPQSPLLLPANDR